MPSDAPNPALAAAIRDIRAREGVTQEDVAYAAGITPGYLSRIECEHSNPSWTTVERIAAGLGVSLVELARVVEGRNRS